MHLSSVTLSLLCVSVAQAVGLRRPLAPPFRAAFNKQAVAGNSTFEQLLDHKNPHLGTFSQRFWWNAEWWNGEGSPVPALPIRVVAGDINLANFRWSSSPLVRKQLIFMSAT